MLYQENGQDFDKTLEQCRIVSGKESPIKNREYDDEEKKSEREEVKEVKLKEQPPKIINQDI